MKIIVVGCGKIGRTIIENLVAEGHDVTAVDNNPEVIEDITNNYDVIGLVGNGADSDALIEAGVAGAELFISVADSDELNMLACYIARAMGAKNTIARVRNPEYADQVMTMRDVFPISMTINPEKLAAIEIERLLKYPGFLRRDTFAKGRSVIVELRIDQKSKLCNVKLMDLSSIVKCRVLVCAVLRSGNAVAPSGNFVLEEGDRIFVTASTADLTTLLKNLGIITRKVRDVMLCGGGRISYYLASLLQKDKVSVQILERNYERCVELASLLPNISVIHADSSNPDNLDEFNISGSDALVTLTGQDETNMIISLYGSSRGVNQIITKLSRTDNSQIVGSLSLGSLIYPKELCSNHIVRYVRAMQNQTGAAVSVHTIADGQVEAMEFLVDETTKNCGIPLKQIKLRPNVLLASLIHGTKTEIPNGDSTFQPGDTLVVVTSGRNVLHQLNDIFA